MNRQSAAATATCNRNTHTNRQQLDVQHPPVHHVQSKGTCVLMTVCTEEMVVHMHIADSSTALHVDAILMGRCGHINSGIIPVCAHQHMNKYVAFKKDCTACARREGCMQMAHIPGLFECGCNFIERHEGQAVWSTVSALCVSTERLIE